MGAALASTKATTALTVVVASAFLLSACGRDGVPNQDVTEADARVPVGSPEAKPPSILLVSLDTLRADRLGCYGHDRDTSPFLDRLAAEGVLF